LAWVNDFLKTSGLFKGYMKFLLRIIVALFLCSLQANDLPGQDHSPELAGVYSGIDTVQLVYPRLVNKFYGINQQKPFWFFEDQPSISLRLALREIIDNAANIGLDRNKYHYAELVNYTKSDSQLPDPSIAMRIDSIFTDIAIAFFKDIYQGANIGSMVTADGVSVKYAETDNNYILYKLSGAGSGILLKQTVNSLEPGIPEYLLLKEKLIQELKTPRPDTIHALVA
jgi:hypothetical protein